MIRFLLDNDQIELSDVRPDLTVLEWLRIHRQRTGTKEGCGSGDCGACTVVVAFIGKDLKDEDCIHYKAINSCITMIGALHGKQLLTVESLAKDDQLHPVQSCMVSEHGSQCGFCTPGFIMSMYSLYQQNEDTSVLKERVDQALGGNLCRCTGYRPIKQAAVKALDMKQTREFTSTDSQSTNQSTSPLAESKSPLEIAKTLDRMLIDTLKPLVSVPANTGGYFAPNTLSALSAFLVEHPDASILAGGTDLCLDVTQQMKTLPSVVSVNAVPELKTINVEGGFLEIGSAVTLSECLDVMSPLIPGSHELLLRFGSDQVRNQGTVGGNIGSASPIGDLPPVLIALDAELTVQCGDANRTVMLADHYLGYKKTTLATSEFIRSIRIPLPMQDSIFAIHKVSKRMDDDISSICMAIHLPMTHAKINDARIAFGGMAAIPTRALQAEHALNGTSLTSESVKQAQNALAEELCPISDARASADYRLRVAQNLLQRVYLEVTTP